MKICPSVVDRSRSYNYITLSSGMTLGKAGPCEAEESEVRLDIDGLTVCDGFILRQNVFRPHHGPDGLSSVQIASVIVMKKANNLIDTSVFSPCYLTPTETCKNSFCNTAFYELISI